VSAADGSDRVQWSLKYVGVWFSRYWETMTVNVTNESEVCERVTMSY